MFRLSVHKDATEDIKKMIAEGGDAEKAGRRIAAFIQELKNSEKWLAELLTRKFRNEEFNVDKFVQFWDAGLDLWRIALFEFDFERDKQWQMPYRILYGYDGPCTTFRILGVVPRNFNYEADHELTKRICRTYDELGMPKHRASAAHFYRRNKRN
jgi:hypothetical protein